MTRSTQHLWISTVCFSILTYSYCWWLKSQTTTWACINFVNNGINYLSLNWLARFLPTVAWWVQTSLVCFCYHPGLRTSSWPFCWYGFSLNRLRWFVFFFISTNLHNLPKRPRRKVHFPTVYFEGVLLVSGRVVSWEQSHIYPMEEVNFIETQLISSTIHNTSPVHRIHRVIIKRRSQQKSCHQDSGKASRTSPPGSSDAHFLSGICVSVFGATGGSNWV